MAKQQPVGVTLDDCEDVVQLMRHVWGRYAGPDQKYAAESVDPAFFFMMVSVDDMLSGKQLVRQPPSDGIEIPFPLAGTMQFNRSRPGCCPARPRAGHGSDRSPQTTRRFRTPASAARARLTAPGAGALPVSSPGFKPRRSISWERSRPRLQFGAPSRQTPAVDPDRTLDREGAAQCTRGGCALHFNWITPASR